MPWSGRVMANIRGTRLTGDNGPVQPLIRRNRRRAFLHSGTNDPQRIDAGIAVARNLGSNDR
jgi:hypothetical protein